MKKSSLILIIPLIFVILFCLYSSYRTFQTARFIQQQHYIGLAESFLHLKLHLDFPSDYQAEGDISYFNNHYYVYFGPTPSLLLTPLVYFFGNKISQQVLIIPLLPLIFLFIYKISRAQKFNPLDSLWLSIFFIFGTLVIHLSLINITAYQVQIISLTFLLAALFLYLYRKNWLLIGVFIALAGSTRFTLYLSSIFFILNILFTASHLKSKLRHLILFALPITLSLILLSEYNLLRFGSFLDTGYSYNSGWSEDLKAAAMQGLFSLQHIPGNIYFLLFKGPDPVRANDLNFILQYPYLKAHPWGMSILFTSPLFIYVFFVKFKEKIIVLSLITILFILIPLLTYYGIGVWQYGYRYALDFYPFLFLCLLSGLNHPLPSRAKLLIVYSIIFNALLSLSIWNIYPLLNF